MWALLRIFFTALIISGGIYASLFYVAKEYQPERNEVHKTVPGLKLKP